MPSEYREIRFTGEELARALYDYAKAQNPQAPLRNPKDLHLKAEPEVSASLRFGQESASYSAAEVTAAILRFARKIGVPIAKRSRKALVAKDGDLMLKLWLD